MPKDTNTAVAEEPSARDQFPENSIADKLFSDEPFEQRQPDSDPTPPEETPTSEPVAEKKEEAPSTENEEIDWESDDPAPQSEDEVDLESDPPNETEARKQAKLRGREAKKLKAELEELRLEKERLAEERDKFKTKAEEYEASTVDPTQHPDFTALRNDILTDVSNAAELMPVQDPERVVSNFGKFMTSYLALEGLPQGERAEKLAALRGQIVDTLADPDVPYAEMTPAERAEYSRLTSDVLSVVQRNVRATKQLGELKSNLEAKAKSGVLLKGVREYETQKQDFQPILDTIGELPDDVIQADPHSPASVVAAMLKKNPEAKKKVETAKNDVLEVLLGPRPLTLDEIRRLETNGTDVRKFLAERDARHQEKRKKMIPLLIQGLLTRSTLKASLAELAKLRTKQTGEEDELAALSSIGKHKPVKEQPKEKPKIPAVERLFMEE